MSQKSSEACHVDESQRELEELELQTRMERIGRKILVLSGKGGVGKSTVAANLAMALATALAMTMAAATASAQSPTASAPTSPTARAAGGALTARLVLSHTVVKPGETLDLAVVLTLAPDHYLYGPLPGGRIVTPLPPTSACPTAPPHDEVRIEDFRFSIALRGPLRVFDFRF